LDHAYSVETWRRTRRGLNDMHDRRRRYVSVELPPAD
jgi:hypothetical protein